MAIGKNKRLSKGGGKRSKGRKIVDPFSRKEWYEVKAPSMFTNKNVCRTLCTRTTGLKVASDSLKGRVFEANLADLNGDESHFFRKMKLRVEDVQGRVCLTNFHGMDFTTDKLRSLLKKLQTLIETSLDVKTNDGYLLRVFAIAFTAKRANANRKSAYAQQHQILRIRQRMNNIITKHAAVDLKDLVAKFIPELIGQEITKACEGIYPLQNVFIRKVKVLRTPKFDQRKLMELYDNVTPSSTLGQSSSVAAEETGAEVAATESA